MPCTQSGVVSCPIKAFSTICTLFGKKTNIISVMVLSANKVKIFVSQRVEMLEQIGRGSQANDFELRVSPSLQALWVEVGLS